MRSMQTAWMGSLLASVALAQSTERASLSSSGVEANGTSGGRTSISADGRYVTFLSFATNLGLPSIVAGQCYLRDRLTGQTTPVSVDPSGAPANDFCLNSMVSADGRYVAFVSWGSNLVPGDTNDIYDVFVRDLQLGQTTRVSVDSNGAQGNGGSEEIDMTPEGRYIAFSSDASLVPDDTNDSRDVYVHDRQTGVTSRVSVSSFGAQAFVDCYGASISADGRYVAFSSGGQFLVPDDTNLRHDVFVHDGQTGETTRVSVDSSGAQGSGDSSDACISRNGRYVVFNTGAQNLSGTTTGGHVVLHDRQTAQTVLISRSSNGTPGNQSSSSACVSSDGRFVSFRSDATNLVLGDTSPTDVFVRDRYLGHTVRASVSNSGTGGDSTSEPWMYLQSRWLSDDGRYVAFPSYSTNLVPGDTNGVLDAFVRDVGPTAITRFCFGDGSLAPCPCGNDGDPERGCANSIFPAGGLLRGYGAPSLGGDTALLQAQDLSGNVCVFFQGTAQMAPTVIDDGLGCVTGTIIRLGTKSVASATAEYPGSGDLAISIKGAIGMPGGARYYQAFYRNAAPMFCPPATTNRTNGVKLIWSP